MHPQFLSPHPPRHDARLLRDLFRGRERELGHVVRELDPRNDHRQLLAIYGETRVGKSHLALRAAQELPQRGSRGYLYVYANAHERLTAERVLWEIFSQLAGGLRTLAAGALSELAAGWMGEIEQFRLGNRASVVLRSKRGQVEQAGRSVRSKGEGSVGGAILGFIQGKVGVSVEGERSSGRSESGEEEETVTVAPPSPEHLAEIIGFMGSVLVEQDRCRRVLLLVDDVDLLSAEAAASGSGETEADLLVDALRRLVALEAFTVVATVREEFRERKGKDFRSLCLVDRFVGEEIAEIYRAHVDRLNRGVSPYAQDAAGFLARCAGGLVGRFLDEADRMRQHFVGADGEFDLDHVVDFYLREAHRLAGPGLQPVLTAVGVAAAAGRATLSLADLESFGLAADVVQESRLLGRVLRPFTSGVFEIDPFFGDALGRGPPGGTP